MICFTSSIVKVSGTFLLFFGEFIIAQALFYIRSVRPAKYLNFFFFKNFYGAFFFGFAFFLYDGNGFFQRYAVWIISLCSANKTFYHVR